MRSIQSHGLNSNKKKSVMLLSEKAPRLMSTRRNTVLYNEETFALFTVQNRSSFYC